MNNIIIIGLVLFVVSLMMGIIDIKRTGDVSGNSLVVFWISLLVIVMGLIK